MIERTPAARGRGAAGLVDRRRGAAADRRHPRRARPTRRRRPSASWSPPSAARGDAGPAARGRRGRGADPARPRGAAGAAGRDDPPRDPGAPAGRLRRARSSAWPRSSARSRARSPARWSTSAAAARPSDRSPACPGRCSSRSGCACCSPNQRRYGHGFALALIDIDGLGRINDAYGREAGDRMVAAVAGVIRRQVRATDQAFRLEEDEFAVLAPHQDAAGLLPMAERIAALIESSQAPEGPRIAIAAGIVACPADGETVERLLESADRGHLRGEGGRAAGRDQPERRARRVLQDPLAQPVANLVEGCRTCFDPAQVRPPRDFEDERHQDQRGGRDARRQPEHAAQLGAPPRLPASAPHARATTGSTSSTRSRRCARRCARRRTSPARSRSRASAAAAPPPRPACSTAFDRFDEAACDRELEQSLAVRSVERTVAEVLLPALEMAERRPNGEAELEHACRWATGWLHGARRLAAGATRPEGVLLLDSGSPLGVEAVHVQALELFLRRAGLRVLLLSAGLAEGRFRSALRALQPEAVVICGSDARLDVLGGALRSPARRGRRRAASTATAPPAWSPAATGSPRSATTRPRRPTSLLAVDSPERPSQLRPAAERACRARAPAARCKFRRRISQVAQAGAGSSPRTCASPERRR